MKKEPDQTPLQIKKYYLALDDTTKETKVYVKLVDINADSPGYQEALETLEANEKLSREAAEAELHRRILVVNGEISKRWEHTYAVYKIIDENYTNLDKQYRESTVPRYKNLMEDNKLLIEKQMRKIPEMVVTDHEFWKLVTHSQFKKKAGVPAPYSKPSSSGLAVQSEAPKPEGTKPTFFLEIKPTLLLKPIRDRFVEKKSEIEYKKLNITQKWINKDAPNYKHARKAIAIDWYDNNPKYRAKKLVYTYGPAALGALIGSFILPGLGTLIGAAVGATVGLITSVVRRAYNINKINRSEEVENEVDRRLRNIIEEISEEWNQKWKQYQKVLGIIQNKKLPQETRDAALKDKEKIEAEMGTMVATDLDLPKKLFNYKEPEDSATASVSSSSKAVVKSEAQQSTTSEKQTTTAVSPKKTPSTSAKLSELQAGLIGGSKNKNDPRANTSTLTDSPSNR
jgi:hypothetical protein